MNEAQKKAAAKAKAEKKVELFYPANAIERLSPSKIPVGGGSWTEGIPFGTWSVNHDETGLIEVAYSTVNKKKEAKGVYITQDDNSEKKVKFYGAFLRSTKLGTDRAKFEDKETDLIYFSGLQFGVVVEPPKENGQMPMQHFFFDETDYDAKVAEVELEKEMVEA